MYIKIVLQKYFENIKYFLKLLFILKTKNNKENRSMFIFLFENIKNIKKIKLR